MIEVTIEKLNNRYRWVVKANGIKQASGLEDNMMTAARKAEEKIKEFENE